MPLYIIRKQELVAKLDTGLPEDWRNIAGGAYVKNFTPDELAQWIREQQRTNAEFRKVVHAGDATLRWYVRRVEVVSESVFPV